MLLCVLLEHRDKLHGTLSTFDEVDAKVRGNHTYLSLYTAPTYPCPLSPDSQSRIKEVRANLKSCKSLLRCKREELKRLWLEDIKYKHMLKMIESMYVPGSYVGVKHRDMKELMSILLEKR